MFQYKRKILLNSELSKRKLPKNFKIEDSIYFNHELLKKFEKVYYYTLRNLLITGEGSPINYRRIIIPHFLAFSSLSGQILFKKIFLILNMCKIFFLHLFKKKKTKIINYGIVLHDRNSKGFFHWFNDIMPKVALCEKKIFKRYKILIPCNLNNKFHKECLRRFKNRIVYLNKEENYIIQNAVYIPELSPSGNPRLKSVINTRNYFRNYFKKSKKKYLSNRIYISRKKSDRRFITNEDQLVRLLKSMKFKIYYFEKMSLKKQIKIISNAKTVIAMHGAALVNIIWMKKNSNVIELRPTNDIFTNCFFSYSNLLNLNYYYLICKRYNKVGFTKDSDYMVDIEELKKVLTLI